MTLQDLQEACKAEDVDRLSDLLSRRLISADDATTYLQWAWPNVDMMRLLLEHGADSSVCATVRYMKKSIAVVRLLVEFGYDIKINGHCILQDYANDQETLDWLLDQGVDINDSDHQRTDTGQRPGQCHDYSIKVLNNVAANGDIELFDHLVARGADPHRSLALHCASKCQDPSKSTAMIDHLLDKYHMDIEADNEKLRDLFHAAGDSGTPLNCAVYYHNIPAMRRLLSRGADPLRAMDATINSTITEAFLSGLEPLLDAGLNVDWALEHAVDHLNVEAVEICMVRGASAATVLEKQLARLTRMEDGTDDCEDDKVPGAVGDWAKDDGEYASKRERLRDYLRSVSPH